jgi:hypothetical protein
MKSIIIVAFVILGCVAFNEGNNSINYFFSNKEILFKALECYSHDVCSANCPQLSNTVKTCTGDDNKCFKAAFPGGVKRGCGKERCNVQVSSFFIILILDK